MIATDLDVEHQRDKELMMTEVAERQQGESGMFQISQSSSSNAVFWIISWALHCSEGPKIDQNIGKPKLN